MPEAVRRQNNKRPMKKSFSLAAIFMAMAFVANVQTAYADRQGFNPKEPACALPAENLLDAANDNFNFKSFEVVADAAKAYFVEFCVFEQSLCGIHHAYRRKMAVGTH